MKVVDFCLTKEQYEDEIANYKSLRLEWATKSSTNQRKGRAGRVSDGKCYRLVPKSFYECLSEYKTPEILRSSLNDLVIDIKRFAERFDGGSKLFDSLSPKTILSAALQPPRLCDIEKTILNLKQV